MMLSGWLPLMKLYPECKSLEPTPQAPNGASAYRQNGLWSSYSHKDRGRRFKACGLHKKSYAVIDWVVAFGPSRRVHPAGCECSARSAASFTPIASRARGGIWTGGVCSFSIDCPFNRPEPGRRPVCFCLPDAAGMTDETLSYNSEYRPFARQR